MTKLWGPLGWATLHSISAAYPEIPNQEDKAILKRYLEGFRDCITCHYCKSHFAVMLDRYTQMHPEWNTSRFQLFLFICRAHNTVNRRLDKPRPSTIEESIETLRSLTKNTSTIQFRQAYITYLINNYKIDTSSEGFMALQRIREMSKINQEYWNPRDKGFDTLSFQENGDVLQYVAEDQTSFSPSVSTSVKLTIMQNNIGLRFRGGKLRIF